MGGVEQMQGAWNADRAAADNSLAPFQRRAIGVEKVRRTRCGGRCLASVQRKECAVCRLVIEHESTTTDT
mgnify:CR=1 FL=1